MTSFRLHVEPHFTKSSQPIDYTSTIFFIGSCFSENISKLLSQRKFSVLSNPSGILFDPLSIERYIIELAEKKLYTSSDLFLYKELYGSWNHHSQFSEVQAEAVVDKINEANKKAYDFLTTCTHCFITLGSAFSYFNTTENRWVANCHKVPQSHFSKILLKSEEILASLKNIKHALERIQPNIQINLTISPVRHLRDGLIENNRSKARLIDAVYQFCQEFPSIYYFPSYEIVIDVLRDYRFFDIDFAHPNYLATQIVFDYFQDLCLNPKSYKDIENFYSLYLALNHRTKHPKTNENIKFLESNIEKVKLFASQFPHLDFSEELAYFNDEYDKLKIRT